MVDTSEDQVFIAVYHDINSTHLYLSEVEGLNYTLSLNYIISPPENEWQNGYPSFDMHVVSMEGVWLWVWSNHNPTPLGRLRV